MDLRKDCELIEVAYESEGKKAVLTFLDEEKGEVLEVNFNKQTYENGAYIEDEEKAKKVDEWCEQEFETDFSSLTQKIGTKKDIYIITKTSTVYGKVNSHKNSQKIWLETL